MTSNITRSTQYGISVGDTSPRGSASDPHFRELAESLPHMVWTCRPDGPCDYLSPQWVAYTGLPEEGQLGDGWMEQLHPDDVELTKLRWAAAATTGQPFDTEFRIRRYDGAYRWFKTRGVPVRDATGRITKWYGTNTDIQALRDAQDSVARANRELESRVQTRTQQLEATKMQLEAAQRLTAIGSWEWVRSTGEVRWSEELFRIFRLDPHSPPPGLERLQALFVPQSWVRFKAAVDHGFECGEGYEMRLTIVRTDGELRSVIAHSEPLMNTQNEVERLVGTFQDITQREHAENELRRLTERLRLATSAARMGVWDWDVESDTVVWDDAMHRLYEVSGHSYELAYDLWHSAVHPDDVTQTETALSDALEGRRDFEATFRIRTPDSRYKYLRAAAIVHRNEAGRPLRMVGVNWDITEQRLAEQALRRSEALQRAVLAHAGPAIIATQCDGTITLFNRAAELLLGHTASEMVGRATPVMIHDHAEIERRRITLEAELGLRIPNPFDVLTAKARLGDTDADQWTYVCKDGRRIPVLLTVTSLKDEENVLIGFLGVAVDLTEQERQQRALAKSLHEREVLLQEVHHRVKNNLQVISSLINMQLRMLSDEASRDPLEECQNRVQTIAIIHEKLYQSKDYTRVPFFEYARDLSHNVFQAAGTCTERVSLELDIDPVALPVDQAIPCGLILNELITNALKHAFPDDRTGTLRVEFAKLDDGRLRLVVADDGVGLPASLEITRSLGLQLVQTLSRQLGAQFEMDTRAGARFVLTFTSEP